MKKTIVVTILAVFGMLSTARAEVYYGVNYFDIHGCKRHLKAIARAVKEDGGKVIKNDSNGRSYRMTLHGTTTVYTCTRYELLETEL
ncbi:MAG: hypothetical protein DSY58_04875 [Desulfobulbus sp.]|nr:MAG: hypothetical protein DSY58_04875 [Desulfobulbus sp.]